MKPLPLSFIAVALILCFLYFKQNRLSITEGAQTTYSYHAESIGYSDIQRLYSPDTSKIKKTFFQSPSLRYAEATINCQITKTVLKESRDSTVVAFQLHNMELAIRNNDVSLNNDVLRYDVMRPVFAILNNNGKIGSVRIDTSISQAASSLVKEIISRLQFVTPGKRMKQWQTQEANSLGIFQADYRFLAKQDTLFEYEKFNKGFLRDASERRHQRLVPDGKSVIYTDSSQHLRHAQVSETLATLSGADTISLSGNKISIAIVEESKASSDFVSDLTQIFISSSYSKTSTLVAVLSDEEIRLSVYRNTLGQENLSSLMQELSVNLNADDTKKEELTMKFRSLAALSPEDCKSIGTSLSKVTYGSTEYEVLSRALSRAGTPCASDALAKVILSRPTEEDLVLDLLPVLATTSAPTDNAINTCRSLGFEQDTSPAIASTAQLALGGIANNFSRIDAEKSRRICTFLFEKMSHHADTLQQLLVLGNTGSTSILPLVKSYLSKPGVSGNICVAAVRALRLVEGDEATKMLKDIIGRKDQKLLEAARETLAFREQANTK